MTVGPDVIGVGVTKLFLLILPGGLDAPAGVARSPKLVGILHFVQLAAFAMRKG